MSEHNLEYLELDSIVVPAGRQREGVGGGKRDSTRLLDELAASIKTYGILNPIIVSDGGELLAGYRRLNAARKAGLTRVPVRRYGELTEIQREEIELDENIQRVDLTWEERVDATRRIHELKVKADPNWGQMQTAQVIGEDRAKVNKMLNLSKLKELFPQIKEAGNLFQAMSRAKALVNAANRTAEQRANPIDYGKLDEKIVLGDSTQIIKLLPDESFHHIITDPPFGIDYDRRISDTGENAATQYKDDATTYETFLAMAPELYRVMKPNGFLFWFLGISWYQKAKEAFNAAGFTVDEVPVVWDRSGGKCYTRRPDRWFAKGYDIALHCVKGEPQMVQRNLPNVIRIDPVAATESEQSVERPIELYAELIRRCSVKGEIIADFFSGSGSCAAAAALNGRDFWGCELDPLRRQRALRKVRANLPEDTVL